MEIKKINEMEIGDVFTLNKDGGAGGAFIVNLCVGKTKRGLKCVAFHSCGSMLDTLSFREYKDTLFFCRHLIKSDLLNFIHSK